MASDGWLRDRIVRREPEPRAEHDGQRRVAVEPEDDPVGPDGDGIARRNDAATLIVRLHQDVAAAHVNLVRANRSPRTAQSPSSPRPRHATGASSWQSRHLETIPATSRDGRNAAARVDSLAPFQCVAFGRHGRAVHRPRTRTRTITMRAQQQPDDGPRALFEGRAWLEGHKEAFQAAVSGAPLPRSSSLVRRRPTSACASKAHCARASCGYGWPSKRRTSVYSIGMSSRTA